MVRKLTETDRKIVCTFLEEEASINLFLLGDIYQFGFEEPFQTLWGSFDVDGVLEGVLLKYHESYIAYTNKEIFDYEPFKLIIKSDQEARVISGKPSVVVNLASIFPDLILHKEYFCEMKEAPQRVSSDYVVKKATVDDVPGIVALNHSIAEFRETAPSAERVTHKIESGSGRIYFIEDIAGKILTAAETTAESPKTAMVVGVCTDIGHRRKGLMQTNLSVLCKDLIEEGKTVCLFYDNPEAGHIYHKIGFKLIGEWHMFVKPKSEEEASISKG